MESFVQYHYVSLPHQGNIFSFSLLRMLNSVNRLLVACLKRLIFYLGFQSSNGEILPIVKEVNFTYIPSGAEIVSVDTFNKSNTKDDFVIGVAIVKNGPTTGLIEFYLNIYSEWDENETFNIESIAQNCLSIELNFIPYRLTHSDLITWKSNRVINKEVVFVLSGSDNEIHVFQEHLSDHLYQEVEVKKLFPEFTKTPTPVIGIDIQVTKNNLERITVLGCECGYVRVTKVCLKNNGIIFNFFTKLNTFVSNVKIFSMETYDDIEMTFDDCDINCKLNRDDSSNSDVNVLVVCSTFPAIIFENIVEYGLSKYLYLPRRDCDSTVVTSCCKLTDIDFDGEKEILIGTSGNEILLYKKQHQEWHLLNVIKYTAPILNIDYVDINADGLKELIIMTSKGIAFLQHNFTQIDEMLNAKANYLAIKKNQFSIQAQ